MVTVNRFFCFRLHTAGIVLGWLGVATSLLNIVTYTILLARIDDYLQSIIDKDSSIPEDKAKIVAITILSIYLTVNVIDCVASILLVTGTIKERHLLIVPWLINCGFSLIFNVTNYVGSVVVLIANSITFATILLFGIIGGIIIGIQLMAWLAMYSLFKLIRMSTEQQRLIPDKSTSEFPSYTRI